MLNVQVRTVNGLVTLYGRATPEQATSYFPAGKTKVVLVARPEKKEKVLKIVERNGWTIVKAWPKVEAA